MCKKLPDLVFKFKDPYEYLNHVWQCKKHNNPSFSLRSWARSLGLTSSSTLTLLLRKKRQLTKNQAVKIIENLKLSAFEADYFEALVDFSLQTSSQGKKYYKNKVDRLRKIGRLKGRALDSFLHLSSPFALLIFEMIGLKEFKNDPQWIKKHLTFDLSVQKIKSIIDILIKLELVIENEKGILQKRDQTISYQFYDNIDDPSLEYHQKNFDLLKRRIGIDGHKKAKFSSYFFNIKRDQIVQAGKTILDFNQDFIDRFESNDKEGEETYQVNFQFLPYTKMTPQTEKKE